MYRCFGAWVLRCLGAWVLGCFGADRTLAPLHPCTLAPLHPCTLAPLHSSTEAPLTLMLVRMLSQLAREHDQAAIGLAGAGDLDAGGGPCQRARLRLGYRRENRDRIRTA